MLVCIFGDQVIESFFISENLDGETCLELLQDAIDAAITLAIQNKIELHFAVAAPRRLKRDISCSMDSSKSCHSIVSMGSH